MRLLDVIRRMRQSQGGYRPMVEVGISQENLLHNLHTYQKTYPALAIAPVLKSNAYGHGLVETARILAKEDIPFFMVDAWYEARRLRRAGIRRRILIMGYVRPELAARANLRDIDIAIVDIEQLRALAALAQRPLRLHLKVDTGMSRQGLLPHELAEASRIIGTNAALSVVGICSHFADADTPGSTHLASQLERWRSVLGEARALFPATEYRHVVATAGVPAVTPEDGNVARIGIGLYGVDTAPGKPLPLRPVLELRSSIVSLRTILAGTSVGYNATHTAQKEGVVATVPVGYFEGVDRRLSNRGAMLIGDNAAPIAGRVSMNMTSLDVTHIPSVVRGGRVVAIGRDPAAPNSVRTIAERTGAHPCEILAHIPEHLRRVVE